MDEYDGGAEIDGGSLEIVPGAWVMEVEEFSAVSENEFNPPIWIK